MKAKAIRIFGIIALPAGAAPAFAAYTPAPATEASPAMVSNAAPEPVPSVPMQTSLPVSPNEIRITGMGSGSVPWTIVVLLTLLTLIPSLLLCLTPFARLLVVFHFLRQALGLQTTPTNQTLIGLALVLTFFLMQPVAASIYQVSVLPMQTGRINAMDAIKVGSTPVHDFMVHYVREKDVALFVDLAKETRSEERR